VRKIEEQIRAVLLREDPKTRNATLANTHIETRLREDGAWITSVYLHGNLIAQNGVTGWGFKLCGWDTPTTRSRLNRIMPLFYPGNPSVHRVRGKLVFTQHGISAPASDIDWIFPTK
jgi:hypothetical protein